MSSTDDSISIVSILNQSQSDGRFDATKWYFKGLVILLISLTLVGVAYSSENISALQEIIISNMQLNDIQYNLIFSFYSIPNIVLVIFGGILVDRIGQGWSTIIFTIIVAIGQLMICIGVYKNIYSILIIGRLLFGIGSESQGIALTKYTILWFDGFMMNFSFGLQMAFAKFAMFLSMLLTHRIYDFLLSKYLDYSKLIILTFVFVIGLTLCIVSVISSIILFILDKRRVETVRFETLSYNNDPHNLKIVKEFSATYWLIISYICIFYLPFSSYNGLAILYFEYKNHISATLATSYLSFYSLVGIFACIFFGVVIGKVGYDCFWFTIAPILCMIGHTCFVYGYSNPLLLMFFRGIGSSIVACSVWPSIRYVVPEKGIGLAYGIGQSLQNFGLTLAPLLIGFLLEMYGYFSMEIFVEYCFGATLILTSAIIIVDKAKTSGILFMSAHRKNAYMSKKYDLLVDEI